MTVPSWATSISIGRRNMTGLSNSLQFTIDAQAIKYNIFGDSGEQSLPGDPAIQLTHSGYFTSGAAGSMAREMYDAMGVDTVIMFVLGTNQAVPVAVVMPVTYDGQLTIDSPVSNLITVKGLWPLKSGTVYRGYALWTGLISATGAKDIVDFGAAGASGAHAWLFVHTINGGPAVDANIAIRTDDNSGGTSLTTRGSFTFSDVGVYELDLATVERYMMINVADLGGATSFNVSVVVTVPGVTTS